MWASLEEHPALCGWRGCLWQGHVHRKQISASLAMASSYCQENFSASCPHQPSSACAGTMLRFGEPENFWSRNRISRGDLQDQGKNSTFRLTAFFVRLWLTTLTSLRRTREGGKTRNLGQGTSRALQKGNGQGTRGLEEEDGFVETVGVDRK